MYRDANESLVSTIERHESEIADLRLRPPTRSRGLVVLAGLSVVGALVAIAACAAATDRADRYLSEYTSARGQLSQAMRTLEDREDVVADKVSAYGEMREQKLAVQRSLYECLARPCGPAPTDPSASGCGSPLRASP
jgi:hypothetical protein